MIALILLRKIITLFLIMFMATLIVKLGFLKSSDSMVVSKLVLWIIVPCGVLNAYQVDFSPEIKQGFLLAVAGALIMNALMFVIAALMRRTFRLELVEYLSLPYTNCGNLIMPLVAAVLGPEWVIFTMPFIAVSQCLAWSHMKTVLSGEKDIDLKKIFLSLNMIIIFIGLITFILQIKFPPLILDTVKSVGDMLGPMSMIVTGMLLANVDIKKVFTFKRTILVTLLRLIVIPLACLLVLKYAPLKNIMEGGEQILMITLLGTAAPSAATLTQMSQLYNRDAEYANSINVVTTLLSALTMPLMIAIYQL